MTRSPQYLAGVVDARRMILLDSTTAWVDPLSTNTSILIRLLLFHLILIVLQSYELKENMSPMKEDLLKCKKEMKKVDSVKRAGSKRSMGRRKRLREASGSFFKIASLRKEAAGKGETGVKKDQREIKERRR